MNKFKIGDKVTIRKEDIKEIIRECWGHSDPTIVKFLNNLLHTGGEVTLCGGGIPEFDCYIESITSSEYDSGWIWVKFLQPFNDISLDDNLFKLE